jgi:uncharacterized protein YoxC
MEEDIENTILKKTWTVENFLKTARELQKDAVKLPKEAKESIPVYRDEWTEENVTRYLERLKESVKRPLRFKSQKLLEGFRISTKGLPEEVLDDYSGLEEIGDLLKKLAEINTKLVDIVTSKELLSLWLKEGIDKAKEKLGVIIEAKTGFHRLFEKSINESLREELIERCIEDHGFFTSAEDIISKIDYLKEFNISVEYKENFDDFKQDLANAHERLKNLQEGYGIHNEEISELVSGKSIGEALKILESKVTEASEKKRKMLEDWKMYSTTLESIGQEVPELPQGLDELEREVKNLREKCLNSLGEEGLRILSFLKGEGDFPDQISKKGLKATLEILRPLFLKFLREES